jgi:hypothetical protein
MAGFGTSQRTPAQDANEGIVNPPQEQVTARSGTAKRTLDPNEGINLEHAGATIGSALQEYVDTDMENIRAKQMMRGATAQGTKLAISEIDDAEKRTGFTKALFGQKSTYRGVQQQAVSNNINKKYLEEMNNVSMHAGETPDAYHDRLQSSLETMLQNFDGDAETKQMVSEQWSKGSTQLASAHAKEHYGLVQTEAREEARKHMRGFVDNVVQADLVTDPNKLQHQANILFNDIPNGMSKEAYQSLLQEETNYGLENGNNTLFNMSKSLGNESGLTPTQAAARKGAVSAYDTRQAYGAKFAWEDVNKVVNGLDESKDPLGDINAALMAWTMNVDQLEENGSESARSLGDIKEWRNRGLALRDKLNKAASKSMAKQDLQYLVTDYMRGTIAGDEPSSAHLSNPEYTVAQRKIALDTVLTQDISRLTGSDKMLEHPQLVEALLTDPSIATSIADSMNRAPLESPFMKNLFNQLIGVNGTRTDPTGRPIPMSKDEFKALQLFDKQMPDLLTDDNFIRYQEMKTGILAGWPPEKVANMADRRIEFKNDGSGANLYNEVNQAVAYDKDDNIRNTTDYVKQQIQLVTGQKPNATQVQSHLKLYKRALEATNGSTQDANKYLKSAIEGSSITYKGNFIAGGKYLDELDPEYTFDHIMELANTPIAGVKGTTMQSSLMTVQFARMFGAVEKGGRMANNLNRDIKGWSIKAHPQQDGFIMSSMSGQENLHISKTDVETLWMPTIRDLALKQKTKRENKLHIKAQQSNGGGDTTIAP